MRQLATIMMFAAWLLYGAMPAMAVMSMAGAAMAGAAINVGPAMSQHAMPVHSGHGDVAQSGSMHGEMQQPCPHKSEGGNKICVAPFCSACLVMPPHITFADNDRFLHRYPAPETGLSLTVSGSAPLTPPPRT